MTKPTVKHVRFHKPTEGTFTDGTLGEYIRSEEWFKVETPDGSIGDWWISPDGTIQNENGFTSHQPPDKEAYKKLYAEWLNYEITESNARESEFYRTHERDIAKPSFDDIYDMDKVDVIEIDYDSNDYPDFCDSSIIRATYDGRELDEEEIELLNEMRDFVYDTVWELIH